MEPVNEVWENQRFYGIIGWQSPGLLERPGASDAEGYPVALDQRPSEEEPLGWRLVVSPATDIEGWQYASVFKHFDFARPGGRASQRVTDLVRRRCWRRPDVATRQLSPAANVAAGRSASQSAHAEASSQRSHGEDVGHVDSHVSAGPDGKDAERRALDAAKRTGVHLNSPAADMQTHRHRKEAEAEKRKAVLKVFVGMFSASIKRWQLWNLMPMDPMSWVVLYNAHHDALADLIASNMRHRLPPETLRETPSAAEKSGVSAPDGGLVLELLRAAIHSRAAYGYAMQAGHVSSVLNFALMHAVHSFSFDAAGGASAEANNEAVCVLAGIGGGDILMAEWNNGVGRPCHYVAIDRTSQQIVLSVRGSLELGDIFSDISANSLEMTLLGCPGQVHEGIMAAATYVHSNTAPALQRAAAEHPGWPLLLTGHSLGGGVAALVAVLLREHGAPEGLGPVHSIGIGPASVMSADLAERCNSFVTSLCLRSDFVPRLTYASVEGMFLELVDASPVRRAAQGVSRKFAETFEGIRSAAWGGKPKSPAVASPTSSHLHGLADVSDLAEVHEAAVRAARTAESAMGPGLAPPDNTGLPTGRSRDTEGDSQRSPKPGRVRRQQADGNSQPSNSGPLHSNGSLSQEERQQMDRKLQPASPAEDFSPVQSSKHDAGHRASPNGDAAMPSPASAKDELAGAAAGGTARAQHAGADEKAVLDDVFADAREAASPGGDSGKPEALYPAGRVLWLIPPDDEATGSSAVSEEDEDEGDEAGLFQSGGVLPRLPAGIPDVPLDRLAGNVPAGADERDRSSSEQGPADASSTSPLKRPQPPPRQRSPAPGRAVRLQQQQDAGGGVEGSSPTGLERGRIIGFGGHGRGGFGPTQGELDESGQPSAGAAAGPDGADASSRRGRPRAPPAVLDVDRRVFARILLSPDTLADHLPDTYLAFLQQL